MFPQGVPLPACASIVQTSSSQVLSFQHSLLTILLNLSLPNPMGTRGSLIRRGPSVQAPAGHVSRARPGRPLRRHFLPVVYVPEKQLLLLWETPGPKSTGSAAGAPGSARWMYQPFQSMTFIRGRTLSTAGPSPLWVPPTHRPEDWGQTHRNGQGRRRLGILHL